jgi:predicted phosphodiesterase
MQIALISDLHGSELALDAVLQDIERRGVERIVCLGDVATLGPRPNAVLAKLRALGCPCILGNHDAFMLDPELIHRYSEAPVVIGAVEWCRNRLSESELAFIRSFVPSLCIELEPETALFSFHGTPESHMTDILATTPAEVLDGMLQGHEATVMAAGHTHIQMLRQHRGTLIVNPGSVGLPFREYVAGRAPALMPHAEYAIVEANQGSVGVTLRRVPLDKSSLREAALASDNPMGEALAQLYS